MHPLVSDRSGHDEGKGEAGRTFAELLELLLTTEALVLAHDVDAVDVVARHALVALDAERAFLALDGEVLPDGARPVAQETMRRLEGRVGPEEVVEEVVESALCGMSTGCWGPSQSRQWSEHQLME